MSASIPPTRLQQEFWNQWNTEHREQAVQAVCIRQAQVVETWLTKVSTPNPHILEVGCGTGWFCASLARFGSVTATDLADAVLARARLRVPQVDFVAGDFMELDFGGRTFDVIVSLEVLSHVADQPAFLRKLLFHLRPGGLLMLATQNRFVLQHLNNIPPPQPGQLRKWVDRRELRELLEQSGLSVEELFTVSPQSNRGIMRWVNSRKLNAPVRAVLGDRVERIKEAMGLGWTLMVLAKKPPR